MSCLFVKKFEDLFYKEIMSAGENFSTIKNIKKFCIFANWFFPIFLLNTKNIASFFTKTQSINFTS